MDPFSYPIARHVRAKLLTSKYTTSEDLRGISAENLSSETGLSVEDAKGLLGLLEPADERSGQPCPSSTAAELLRLSDKSRRITTSSKKLDEMLGGGIPLSKLTEICGIPGSGKTQICFQLVLNVQLQNSLGELRGEALYVDTEGSFSVERLSEMAKAALRTSDGSSLDRVIRGVHYRRCLDCPSFLDTINTLQDFVANQEKVRLIVIDNIAYHFRRAFDSNYQLRTRTMFNVTQILAELAHKHSIAVVLTNQMTTRIEKDGQSVLVPSLGDSWSHCCCNRIILSFDKEARSAVLVKSSYRPYSTASFQIETAGICDVPMPAENHPSSSIGSQLGFYENTIGTSEAEADNYANLQVRHEGGSRLGAAAKKPRLDLGGSD